MDSLPGFVVVSSLQFPSAPRADPSDDYASQQPFDITGTALNLDTIDKLSEVLDLDDEAVVDCRMARRYIEVRDKLYDEKEAAAAETSRRREQEKTSLDASTHGTIDTHGVLADAVPPRWPFEQTALDFRLSPDEVKKRAAWSWLRSASLMESQAEEIEQAFRHQAEDLELKQSVQLSTAESLRVRAAKARSLGTKLDPEAGKHDLAAIPPWAALASNSSEEEQNESDELVVNHKLVAYAIAARQYNTAAKNYIMEAISTYLRDIHYIELSKTKGPLKDVDTLTLEALEKEGSFVKIWAKAVEWSTTSGPLPPRLQFFKALAQEHHGNLTRERNPRTDFREWWQRAAFAKAHSAWVESKLSKLLMTVHGMGHTSQASRDAAVSSTAEQLRRRWNDFHTQPPPSIRDYEKDSEIRSKEWLWHHMIQEKENSGEGSDNDDDDDDDDGEENEYIPEGSPEEADKIYNTLYKCIATNHYDKLSLETGAEPISFVYGCPDSILKDQETSGWEPGADFLGLLDGGVALQDKWYERYLRKGLVDYIPEPTEYDSLLALAADDLVVSYDHDLVLGASFDEIYRKAGLDPGAFTAVLKELSDVGRHRQHMTLRAAGKACFAESVFKIITDFLELLVESPYFQQMGAPALGAIPQLRLALMHMQGVLNRVLDPFIGVDFRFNADGNPISFLYPDFLVDPEFRQVYSATKSLSQWAEWGYGAVLKLQLDTLRQAVQETGTIPESAYQMAELFRETLVSGDPEKLPTVARGLPQHRRRDDHFFAVLEKNHFDCPPGCACQGGSGPNKEKLESLSDESRGFIAQFNEARRNWRHKAKTAEEEALCEQFAQLLSNA